MSPSSPSPSVMRVEDLEHALGADAAGDALAARLSFWVNCRKYLARSTMQVLSSATTMPPEPTMAPVAARLS